MKDIINKKNTRNDFKYLDLFCEWGNYGYGYRYGYISGSGSGSGYRFGDGNEYGFGNVSGRIR